MTKAIRWTPKMLEAHMNRRKREPDTVPMPKKQPKYRNQKVEDASGVKHDSRKEARRWAELQAMQEAGQISELKRQVPFVLAPSVRLDGEKRMKPAIRYIADFTFIENGSLVVMDVKSAATRRLPAYRLKRHLLATVHGLQIREA